MLKEQSYDEMAFWEKYFIEFLIVICGRRISMQSADENDLGFGKVK